jgi:hypothetical protein
MAVAMVADVRVNAKEQELQRAHLQRLRSVGSKENPQNPAQHLIARLPCLEIDPATAG